MTLKAKMKKIALKAKMKRMTLSLNYDFKHLIYGSEHLIGEDDFERLKLKRMPLNVRIKIMSLSKMEKMALKA